MFWFVTLLERKSRRVRLGWVKRKTADAVTTEIVRLMRGELVKSITFDNGKEFAGHAKVAAKLTCKCYFADPSSSWQRSAFFFRRGLPKVIAVIDFRRASHDIKYERADSAVFSEGHVASEC